MSSRLERIELENTLIMYNDAYRRGEPMVSDEEYDKLVEELKENYSDSELLERGVIEEPKQSRKEKLPLQMASLNKCKSIEELMSWLKSKGVEANTKLVITPKFDGISLLVDEMTGYCWTRGDGEYGQKSGIHFSKMNNSNILTEDFYSYGEAIMPKSKFEKYKDRFANPRNMVAGLFNRNTPDEALSDVDYVRYGSNLDVNKVTQLFELWEEQDMAVPAFVTDARHIDDFNHLEKLYEEWSVEYQIDGLVVDIDLKHIREALGREENGNPAYARAYKNPAWGSVDVSRVTGITWKVSKQGRLKPVVQIEPTVISGVTITNVTGYNAKYVFDNNIAIDSMIKVVRSGDVIPKHIETNKFDQFQIYLLEQEVKYCPSCGERTGWDETDTELVCMNEDCIEKKIAKLVHFFSTVEIEDFGEPSIRKFYNSGYDSVCKIFSMSVLQIEEIEGFGYKTGNYLVNEFMKLQSRGIPLAKLLHALDVMEGRIGEKTIQLILDNVDWSDIDKPDVIVQVDGVADKTAKIFVRGLERFWHEEYELYLPVHIKYVKSPKQEVVGDRFKGENICFTGCRPSKELKEEIESQGGNVVSGVSGKTTMLVVKNMSEKVLSSSKAKKAKDLGIKIVEISSL